MGRHVAGCMVASIKLAIFPPNVPMSTNGIESTVHAGGSESRSETIRAPALS